MQVGAGGACFAALSEKNALAVFSILSIPENTSNAPNCLPWKIQLKNWVGITQPDEDSEEERQLEHDDQKDLMVRAVHNDQHYVWRWLQQMLEPSEVKENLDQELQPAPAWESASPTKAETYHWYVLVKL